MMKRYSAEVRVILFKQSIIQMLIYFIRNHDCQSVAFALASLAELTAETISAIVLEQADLIVAIRFRATAVNDLMLRILANPYK
jgi:hypothetical protein